MKTKSAFSVLEVLIALSILSITLMAVYQSFASSIFVLQSTKTLWKAMAETQKEEEMLLAKSEEYKGMIEARLVDAYDRIRSATKNKLAVVSVERGASAGSFFVIPPQRQMELAQRKKIMIDEHSGRILVDPVLAQEEEDKMDAMIADWLK